MNFLLALVEIILLCAVIVYDISLGYSHGHKLVDMPLNIFLLSVFLKVPEWLIGAAFTTTVFRIKYIRYMRRERKRIKLVPTRPSEILVGKGLGEILTKEEGQKRINAYAVKRDPGLFGLKVQWYSALFAALFGLNLYTWIHFDQWSVNPFICLLGLCACPLFWFMGMIIKYQARRSKNNTGT